MPTVTSVNKVQCACLFFLSVLAFSCTNSNPNIDAIQWENLDSAKGISYYITEKGNAGKGKISLKYAGYFNKGKFVADTAVTDDFMLEMLISSLVQGNPAIKEMPKRTTGFIRMDLAGFFLGVYKNMKHYTLSFPPSNKQDFEKDSLQLAVLDKFARIEITSSAKALENFEEDNDTTWRQFIKENPLPHSIDLTLKKELLTEADYDSVKNTLQKLFPQAELELFYKNGLNETGKKESQVMLYSFIVF
jgi:hypothetical protein